MRPLEVLFRNIDSNCPLKGRCAYCMILNDVFFAPVSQVRPMGPSRILGCHTK